MYLIFSFHFVFCSIPIFAPNKNQIAMEKDPDTTCSSHVIAAAYTAYYPKVLVYIVSRIHRPQEAEDLTQDVFLRLLDYQQMIQCTTVKYFIFTIARNIVTDYIRHYYVRQQAAVCLYNEVITYTNETEEALMTADLAKMERKILANFPSKRKTIYGLSRYEEKSVDEIAAELQLSPRTVENHLFLGRKVMRTALRQCI